ncbi:MAG: Ig-like domain-containing protein, partial [Clostridia bacterium]|nr:Ig-like domain-containing protein [Clostridia bacterium]
PSAAPLLWESSNTKIAKVDQKGTVTAVAVGTAVIRVSVANRPEVYAQLRVNVRPKPSKVTIKLSELSVGVGQSVPVEGTISFSGGSCAFSPVDTTYARVQISDTSIADYDEASGCIVAKEVGRTKVRLITYNKKTSQELVFVVNPGAEWLLFNEVVAALSEGETREIYCERSAGSVSALEYISSNPAVATVVGKGERCAIHGVKAGSCVITARASNGVETECAVTVLEAPTAVSFSAASLTMNRGERVQLPSVRVESATGNCFQQVQYTSSSDIVEVSADGFATGLSAGICEIVASTYNGQSARCIVTVLPAPTWLTLSAERNELGVGERLALKVETDAQGRVSYQSENEDILSVDENGILMAIQPGVASVTAIAYNGISDTLELTVRPWVEYVRFSAPELVLNVGETIFPDVETDGGYGDLIFTSGIPEVVSVSSTGELTAKSVGSTVLRVCVRDRDEVFDACTVTVRPQPESLQLDRTELSLPPNAHVALSVALLPEGCDQSVRYDSSDESVASISAEGEITAHGVG